MRLGFRLQSWERSPSASQPCWDLKICACRAQPGARCWGNAASHRAAASPAYALPAAGFGGLGCHPHPYRVMPAESDPPASCHPLTAAGLLVGSSPGWRAVPNGLGNAGTLSCPALPGRAGAGGAHAAFLGPCGLEWAEISPVWARSLQCSSLAGRLGLAAWGFLLEGDLERTFG